jgi:hypothetical protein
MRTGNRKPVACSFVKFIDMKKLVRRILLLGTLLFAALSQQAQVLNVTVVNIGNNVVRIIGTATAPGFDASPNNSWSSMNLTWRIPKPVTVPAPTVAPPSTTPELTGETTGFTGASPRDAFNNTGLDLTMFDLTTFGQPDDGYWYLQVTGTVENVQNISSGNDVILYEFVTPVGWSCASCVEILVSDIPGIPISTTSFIDNGGLGQDVLNVVSNMGPLPVLFLGFEANRTGNDVELNWKVSNEENIKGYYVERSADGISWQTIGFVAFRGPSSGPNNYSLLDQNPLKDINYYRISHQDIDGGFKYSVTRVIHMDNNVTQVHLYPVPVKDMLKVNIQSSFNSPATIKIMDALGHIIHQNSIRLRSGVQTEEIKVSHMKAGLYIIEIQNQDFRWSGKFIRE